MTLVQEKESEKKPSTFRKASCKSCGHVRVCAIYRAVSPLLERNFTDETRPFDAEDLACICREFIPASLLNIQS